MSFKNVKYSYKSANEDDKTEQRKLAILTSDFYDKIKGKNCSENSVEDSLLCVTSQDVLM